MSAALGYLAKRTKEDVSLFLGLFEAILTGPFKAAIQVGKQYVHAHHGHCSKGRVAKV